MRSLIISAVSLLLILAVWLGFMTYCENTLSLLVTDITQELETSVIGEDWSAAEEQFRRFSGTWHKDKELYSLFLEQSAMLDTDFSISRAEAYIKAQDAASALGELYCIREQLKFLFLNEKISLENIL